MTAQTPSLSVVAAPNVRTSFLDAPGLKTGFVAGIVVIYLGMVGMIEAFSDLFLFPHPVVAAVNGHAIAGGAVITAAADYRIMASGSGRIGVP